jgi:hypothetical protein
LHDGAIVRVRVLLACTKVDHVVNVLQFHFWKDEIVPNPHLPVPLAMIADSARGGRGGIAGVPTPAVNLCRRKDLLARLVVQNRQAELLEVVRALHAAGAFARGLHGGEQERDQDADDGNDDQQFDQGKRGSQVTLHGSGV